MNPFDRKKMIADIRQLKKKTEFIIVCLHFGKEYQTYPSRDQQQLMQFLFKQGVNVVIGTHPHVLHPVTQTVMKDIDGKVRNRVAASSLGNFVSSKLTKSENTIRGMILSLTLTKNENGIVDVLRIDEIPTIVKKRKADKTTFTVVPVR